MIKDGFLDQELLSRARDFVFAKPSYCPTWTTAEKFALLPFFTNGNKKVFFIHSLPTSIISALLAMYSRLKNPRGLRGHFVDNLMPMLLCSTIKKFQDLDESDPKEAVKSITSYLKNEDLTTLDKFLNFSGEHEGAFARFLNNVRIDKNFMERLANSPKARVFLGTYLDSYGHNSIARTANLVFGVEDVSILAAKSLEWGRPGAGYIELSTRYVDFSTKSFYPIWEELSVIDKSLGGQIQDSLTFQANIYEQLFGKGAEKGWFSAYLEDNFSKLLPEKDVKSGAFGESCDVAANVLPCATLTSLGISLTGEAFPELIKHLLLDGTYENRALAELIVAESETVGGNHFLRHIEPSEWRKKSWGYLAVDGFEEADFMMHPDMANQTLLGIFRQTEEFKNCRNFPEIITLLKGIVRKSHDKLPNQFEFISAGFARKMSFRSWRDIHRQGFSTHLRTIVTPELGFYRYDKPAPPELERTFELVSQKNRFAWQEMRKRDIPPVLAQYAMAMGNIIGMQIGANLLQWEFVNWQRTKYTVNHEVRQIVLSIERSLRQNYEWWAEISRADMEPAYVCARGSKRVPLKLGETK